MFSLMLAETIWRLKISAKWQVSNPLLQIKCKNFATGELSGLISVLLQFLYDNIVRH